MSRLRAIPMVLAPVLVFALTAAGCGKKKAKSETQSKAKSMAPMVVTAPRPDMARPRPRGVVPQPRKPALPANKFTPGPPVVQLTGEVAALAKVVQDALRANKPDSVVALLPSLATVKGCPQLSKGAAKDWGSFDKAVARTTKQVRAAFARCHALGDWKAAKRVEARQPKTKNLPVGECKRLIGHGHIYLAYIIGGKSVIVKLGSPARVDGKSWVLLDGIRCSHAGDLYR